MKLVRPVALLDTCVMVPAALRDTLLRLAEAGLFRPAWSGEILEDTLRRTLEAKIGLAPRKAAYLEREISRSFPDALVVGYDVLTPKMANDPKDRHVLAAAVKARARLIVTYNKRHFPQEATQPWGVDATGPSTFLEELLSQEPQIVVEKLREQAGNLGRSLTQQMDVLHKAVPSFVEAVRKGSMK
jgi:predicted nucleic acid-binding protein